MGRNGPNREDRLNHPNMEHLRRMPAGAGPVICTASAVYGEGEFPYTSKTTLLFVNPTASLSYTEKSLFKTQ